MLEEVITLKGNSVIMYAVTKHRQERYAWYVRTYETQGAHWQWPRLIVDILCKQILTTHATHIMDVTLLHFKNFPSLLCTVLPAYIIKYAVYDYGIFILTFLWCSFMCNVVASLIVGLVLWSKSMWYSIYPKTSTQKWR